MKGREKFGAIGLALTLLLLALAACDHEQKAKEQAINVNNSDPRGIIAPGQAGVLSGTTLLVPTVPHTYHVYSVPEFAGVEVPGQIGIGNSIGYNPGERVLLPINVNLGAEELGSYAITLTVEDPAAIQIVDVDGSIPSLATSYPTQYQPAEGFENQPLVTIGDTITTLSFTSASPEPTTGRVNLANVTVDILAPGPLPPAGTFITFTLDSLQAPGGQDLCVKLAAGPCTAFDGIFIENFKVQ